METIAETTPSAKTPSSRSRRTPSTSSGRKKKRPPPLDELMTSFEDLFELTDEVLGRGSEGDVVTAIRKSNGLRYAVKIIEKDGHFSRINILRELEVLHLCRDHPSIINMVDYFESDKMYIVYEIAEGGALFDHLKRRTDSGLAFSESEAAEVIRDIASALDFLHGNGIAHRDVKPQNLLCLSRDYASPCKLADLGLCSGARVQANQEGWRTPTGTAGFIAPEMAARFADPTGSTSYSTQADIWSLGVVTFMLLFGVAPFDVACGRVDCRFDDGYDCEYCEDILLECICRGKFSFPDDEEEEDEEEDDDGLVSRYRRRSNSLAEEPISASAKDLIKRLLHIDPKARLTAAEILQHPWVRGTTAPKTPLSTPLISTSALALLTVANEQVRKEGDVTEPGSDESDDNSDSDSDSDGDGNGDSSDGSVECVRMRSSSRQKKADKRAEENAENDVEDEMSFVESGTCPSRNELLAPRAMRSRSTTPNESATEVVQAAPAGSLLFPTSDSLRKST